VGDVDAQRREHLRAAGAQLGVAREEAHAQSAEVVGYARRDVEDERRVERALLGDHVRGGPVERAAPRERLEEEDPRRVPVRRRAHRLAEGQLGRHVRHGPDDLDLLLVARRHLGDDAEVDEDDATGGVDQDVGRLQIAVHLPGAVEEGEPRRELAKRVTETRVVEPRARLRQRRGRRLGRRRRRRWGNLDRGMRGEPVAAVRSVDARARPAFTAKVRGRAGVRRPGGALVEALHAVGSHVGEEVLPANELHREEPAPGVLDQIAEAHQVGVAQVTNRAELHLEAGDLLGPQHAQRLQRDGEIALQIDRLVHRALRPAPQLAEDAEARQSGGLAAWARGGHVAGSRMEIAR
jgi:hypothetical protein